MKRSQKSVPRKSDRQGLKFTRRSRSRHFHFRCRWILLQHHSALLADIETWFRLSWTQVRAMNDHACHLLWLTWSGRLVYMYDGSRSCHLHSSKLLWRMHQNYATLHAGVLQQRYPMAYWQLLKPATEQMHYSSSPSLHPSEEERENIKFYV